jgi:hypothetical protein
MEWLVWASLVAALLLGIWLGMPRRYDQSLQDIEERMSEGGEHQTVQRHFTFLNNLKRTTVERASQKRRRSSGRSPFRLR